MTSRKHLPFPVLYMRTFFSLHTKFPSILYVLILLIVMISQCLVFDFQRDLETAMRLSLETSRQEEENRSMIAELSINKGNSTTDGKNKNRSQQRKGRKSHFYCQNIVFMTSAGWA